MGDDIALLPPHVLRATHVPKRGHADRPGTGPAGETCGTCRHYTVKHMSKTYRKCGLTKATWTGGPGSDIRKKDPACSRWEAAADQARGAESYAALSTTEVPAAIRALSEGRGDEA